MKDIPVFTTEHGAASLFLREIPYRKRAHIKLQATQEPEKLLEECISFCRACGAEWIDAAGNDCLERYPLITAIVAMQCEKAAIPETDVCLFPVTENTVSKWLDIYNERMADVPNAAYLDSKDGLLYNILYSYILGEAARVRRTRDFVSRTDGTFYTIMPRSSDNHRRKRKKKRRNSYGLVIFRNRCRHRRCGRSHRTSCLQSI